MPSNIERITELVNLCKKHHTFKYENLICNGYYVDVVKLYVAENPSAKFRTWLVNKGFVLFEL